MPLSGVFSRVTEDIAAFNTSISSIAKTATTDLERATREITEPTKAVGEEDLSPQALDSTIISRPPDDASVRARHTWMWGRAGLLQLRPEGPSR